MIQTMVLLISLTSAVDVQTTAVEKELLAAMNAWKQALLIRDRAALEALYSPDLTYIHSNGRRENKIQAIEAVASAKDRYESIDMSDVSIKAYGNVALVYAHIIMRINNGETVNILNLDVLHVWMKANAHWQLLSRHAARMNP